MKVSNNQEMDKEDSSPFRGKNSLRANFGASTVAILSGNPKEFRNQTQAISCNGTLLCWRDYGLQ